MEMVYMGYFCPKCYGARYETVPLVKDGEEYVCKQDPKHVFYIDTQGFPRTKK
jgi:hypothetical protein